MSIDMSATAAANGPSRRASTAAIVASDASGSLQRFSDFVGRSALSSNVSADKIHVYDQAGEVLDTRRHHIAVASGDVVVGLQEFADRQGPYLARREAFEGMWLHGDELVYGAVNAGGMGTVGRFGPFCLVVADPATPAPDALGVFPSDSAQRYTTAAGTLDRDAAVAEATTGGIALTWRS